MGGVWGVVLLWEGWTLPLDGGRAAGVVHLPIRRMLSVDAVGVLPSSGAPALLHPSTYIVDTTGWRGRIVRAFGSDWPRPGKSANGIEIELTTDFGTSAADVPAPMAQSFLLLVAH